MPLFFRFTFTFFVDILHAGDENKKEKAIMTKEDRDDFVYAVSSVASFVKRWASDRAYARLERLAAEQKKTTDTMLERTAVNFLKHLETRRYDAYDC